tara:strand:- start:928 stop:1182 length:255 start_codon:yes stop_codon:yes gene_type:complete
MLHRTNPYEGHPGTYAQRDLHVYEVFAEKLWALKDAYYDMERALEITPDCIDDIPGLLADMANDTVMLAIADAKEAIARRAEEL